MLSWYSPAFFKKQVYICFPFFYLPIYMFRKICGMRFTHGYGIYFIVRRFRAIASTVFATISF